VDLDFKVLRLQIALFLATMDQSDKLGIAQHIVGASAGLLDGEPVVLPIPKDSPPELPRILLQSKDGNYTCQVTGERIDLIFRETSGTPRLRLKDLLDQHVQIAVSVAEVVSKEHKASMYRIGFVTELLSELEVSSNQFIRDRFLKTERFPLPYQTNINLLHRSRTDTFDINRWFKISTLRNKEDPENDLALTVTFDINSLPERKYDLDGLAIRRFCQHGSILIKEGLAEYFEGD